MNCRNCLHSKYDENGRFYSGCDDLKKCFEIIDEVCERKLWTSREFIEEEEMTI
jgi:hypothetical protein